MLLSFAGDSCYNILIVCEICILFQMPKYLEMVLMVLQTFDKYFQSLVSNLNFKAPNNLFDLTSGNGDEVLTLVFK